MTTSTQAAADNPEIHDIKGSKPIVTGAFLMLVGIIVVAIAIPLGG